MVTGGLIDPDARKNWLLSLKGLDLIFNLSPVNLFCSVPCASMLDFSSPKIKQMKKSFFIVAIAAIALISCKDNTSSTDASATANSQDEKNLANNAKVYKAIETGDVSPIDSLIATDAVDHDGGEDGKDMVGKDSILHMLGNLHNNMKDLKLDVISSATNGDYIFTLVHVTGTSADSSHMKIDEMGTDVVKVKDGKMTEHWGFTEDKTMAQRMMAMQDKMKDMGKKK